MAKVTINEKYCKACGLCVEVCPKRLIKCADKLNAAGVAPARWDGVLECTGCSLCYLVCPDAAIEIER